MGERAVRLREANRTQLRLEPINLDQVIDENHPARAIWELLHKLDVSRFEEPIKAREGTAGRDATDPRILLALWIYAISEGWLVLERWNGCAPATMPTNGSAAE